MPKPPKQAPSAPAARAGPQHAGSVSCIICAESITRSAVSPCNNVTCHICCFRQRALYKKKTCLVCRTEHDDVIITRDILEEAKYDDYVALSRPFHLKDYSIHFTDAETKNETMALLELKCSVCSEAFSSFRKLSDHTKTVHGKQYCDICAQHKKSFLVELDLYTAKQLLKHMNGEDSKGASGRSHGFKGHPKCKFCHRQRFYSEDEMNIHIRDMHERCYICNQDNFVATDYYKNYDDLFGHFENAHYVCHVQACLDKKFVVFREDLDLAAHMLKEHGGIMGQNNRVVIGTSAPKFRSRLSTFDSASTNADTDQSLQVKRLRFNERAKHYLKNDQAKIQAFNECNDAYKCRKISASDLLNKYNDLFSNNEQNDIALLLYEHVELLPQHTDQRRALQALLDRFSNTPVTGSRSLSPGAANASNVKSFPLLSGSQNSGFVAQSWGNSSASRASRDEMFPALAKPKQAVSVPKNQPIRYTTVKLTPEQPKTKVNVFRENKAYKPSYLDGQRAAPVSTQSKAAPPLLESRFPALEQRKKKPLPPPVKPVQQSPTLWGNGIVQSPASDPVQLDFGGIPITAKKAGKKKRGKN